MADRMPLDAERADAAPCKLGSAARPVTPRPTTMTSYCGIVPEPD